jgi:hypothetical protein
MSGTSPFTSRVSSRTIMHSPSRHGRQGGVVAENTPDGQGSCDITAYEELRNRRKRELHEEVQRALLISGYPEAANLRNLFSGEVRPETPCGTKGAKESSRRRRSNLRDVAGELRRSARNIGKTETTNLKTPAQRTSKKKVTELKPRKVVLFACSGII